MQREKLGSRLGFVLLSAGCAIGIGNVWKFPYVAGENGGGVFVLLYILFLIIMGIPVMTMEFSLGRSSKKSIVKMYNELEEPGSKWHFHGIVAMCGNYLLMMFYTCVTGWMVQYFIKTANGSLSGLTPDGVKDAFSFMQADTRTMILSTLLVVIVGFLVCSFSLQNGVERVTKYMMIALLGLIIVLAINSLRLPNSLEGLSYYLLPNFEKVKQVGFFNIVVAAMNQAFFTLSLGMGSMAIFASYLGDDRSLLGESVNVATLDTFVAIVSGLIIFPACSAYNIDYASGPPLIFVTLPNIFNNMPQGRFWGSLFFVFMIFAALSTVFAVFENIVSCTRDLTGWSKKKACFVNCIAMSFLCMPCVLGFNVFSSFKPFAGTSSILDLEDFLVSNIILPIGALVILLFCTSKRGWGWNSFKNEANKGKGLKVGNYMRKYVTYVLPVIIVIVFIIGIVGKVNEVRDNLKKESQQVVQVISQQDAV